MPTWYEKPIDGTQGSLVSSWNSGAPDEGSNASQAQMAKPSTPTMKVKAVARSCPCSSRGSIATTSAPIAGRKIRRLKLTCGS